MVYEGTDSACKTIPAVGIADLKSFALYGFPFNAIITESMCKEMAATEDEREYLMAHMFPSMIVGGFSTVTITSVIIAGLFVNLL